MGDCYRRLVKQFISPRRQLTTTPSWPGLLSLERFLQESLHLSFLYPLAALHLVLLSPPSRQSLSRPSGDFRRFPVQSPLLIPLHKHTTSLYLCNPFSYTCPLRRKKSRAAPTAFTGMHPFYPLVALALSAGCWAAPLAQRWGSTPSTVVQNPNFNRGDACMACMHKRVLSVRVIPFISSVRSNPLAMPSTLLFSCIPSPPPPPPPPPVHKLGLSQGQHTGMLTRANCFPPFTSLAVYASGRQSWQKRLSARR